jgi:hypothetical protein
LPYIVEIGYTTIFRTTVQQGKHPLPKTLKTTQFWGEEQLNNNKFFTLHKKFANKTSFANNKTKKTGCSGHARLMKACFKGLVCAF